jgi:hypothetical protein
MKFLITGLVATMMMAGASAAQSTSPDTLGWLIGVAPEVNADNVTGILMDAYGIAPPGWNPEEQLAGRTGGAFTDSE